MESAHPFAPHRRALHVHIPKTAGTSLRTALGLADPTHMTASELRSYVGDAEWSAGFSFAIVRNPFDRLVSIYAFGLGHKRPSTRERFQSTPFPDWVRGELLDDQHPRVTARRTYAEWIDDRLDYVGRFEDLPAAWTTIQQQLHVALPALPVIHKTEHRHYRDLFDDETRQLVESHFAADLELYGYCF